MTRSHGNSPCFFMHLNKQKFLKPFLDIPLNLILFYIAKTEDTELAMMTLDHCLFQMDTCQRTWPFSCMTIRYNRFSFDLMPVLIKLTVECFLLRCTVGCPPKKHLFGRSKLASKYNVTCRARDTLTEDGSSPLSFASLSRASKRSAWPLYTVENSKLRKAHRMLIRQLWTREKQTCDIHNTPYQYFDKYSRKTKWSLLVVLFTVNIFKSIGNRAFRFVSSLFALPRAFE